MEVAGMSEHTFSLTVGIVFLLVAIGHSVRLVFGVPLAIQGVSVPLWASAIAVVVTGFLSYEGFHFAGKSRK
jgi:hypothetical protein